MTTPQPQLVAVSRPPSEAADRFQPDAGRVSLFSWPASNPDFRPRSTPSDCSAWATRISVRGSHPALWPVAGDDREPDRASGRRAVAARGLSVDPYRRANGPVWYAPGHAVFRLDGDRLAPVFPLLPWFWPLLLLQVVNGGALPFAWSGAQTMIAQLAEGEAEYIGRFSFFARIGTTWRRWGRAAWDFGGAWPAYALGVAWGVALTVALLARRKSQTPLAVAAIPAGWCGCGSSICCPASPTM